MAGGAVNKLVPALLDHTVESIKLPGAELGKISLTLHGGLDQGGERRVGEAGGDDRGRDVRRVWQIGGVERVHAGATYRGIAWQF